MSLKKKRCDGSKMETKKGEKKSKRQTVRGNIKLTWVRRSRDCQRCVYKEMNFQLD